MNDKTVLPFSSAEALGFGWTKTKANLKPLLIIGAVGAFLALLEQALRRPDAGDGLSWLLAFVVQVLQVGVMLVYIRAALKLHDDRPLELSSSTDLLADFFSFLLTSLLQGLIVAVGFILLIVPGVVWALKFAFAGFLVVDQKLDPIEALRESSRLTQGVKRPLFGFALFIVCINLLGALALGIGLLVTIPTTLVAAAYVFRRLQTRAASRAQLAPTPRTIPTTPVPAETH